MRAQSCSAIISIEENNGKKDRIQALNGLRVIAAFMVFLSHCNFLEKAGWMHFSLISYARLAVTFFFVLSGFAVSIGYSDEFQTVDKKCFSTFMRKRINKLYPVYIISLLVAVPLSIYRNSNEITLFNYILRAVLCIFCLQSAVPLGNYAHSYNGVAWFLSCIFIFYLCAPFLLRWNHKIKKNLKYVTALFGINIILFGLVYMLFRYLQYYKYPELNLSLVYSTPYIRIFAFVAGILLYDIWELTRYDLGKNINTLCEFFISTIFIVWWLAASSLPIPTVLAEIWNTIISSVAIYVISLEHGAISGVLGRPWFTRLGSISLEFYLLHYLIIGYGELAINHVTTMTIGIAIIAAVLFLILSVFISFWLRGKTKML